MRFMAEGKKRVKRRGDERAHSRKKSKKAVVGPGRNIYNWIKNRKETAHNFLTSSEEAVSSDSLCFVQVCDVVRKPISLAQSEALWSKVR